MTAPATVAYALVAIAIISFLVLLVTFAVGAALS